MKNRVILFILVALFMLAAIPAVNLIFGNAQEKKEGKRWSRKVLYNVDFTLPFLNRFLYPLGISTNPTNVVIGKNGWLYLGGSTQRFGSTTWDEESARNIGRATNSWEQWLKLNGVRLYRVMLGPDKETIYPEYTPNWMRPAANSATDSLLANVNPEIYIDTRPALIAAKSQFPETFYYKTDTHWNSLGAWLAYRAFSTQIARTESELQWLSDQQVHVSKIKDCHGADNECLGGDLANFLRLKEILPYIEPVVSIDSEHHLQTEQYDFESGKIISAGENSRVGSPMHPLLVKSKPALNQKRVLWLRDSFGTALAPYMSATFSEILQIHYSEVDPARFAQLVYSFKPDYVFITVVERATRDRFFETSPPITVTQEKPKNLYQ